MLLQKNRGIVMLLCFLMGAALVSCQPAGEEQPSGSSQLERLLSFIPPDWADMHLPVGFGPTIYFYDFHQMRLDLSIPQVTGEDSPEDKQSILRGLNIQNLRLFALSVDLSGNFFEEWGWDLADVDQVLHLPDLNVSILLGNFSRSEIEQHLLDKGDAQSESNGFTIFALNDPAVIIAQKPDTIIITPSDAEAGLIEGLIQQGMDQETGLYTHSAVASILEQRDDLWGAVLLPSPDIVTYAKEVVPTMRLPSEYSEFLREYFLEADVQPYGWDFMAITFKGADGEDTAFQFLYHYPEEGQAQQDVDLARVSLTETPLPSRRGRIMGDFITLEDIEVQDTVLVARARSKSTSLIGSTLDSLDFWGFLLIRRQ